jgi:hypothetical protein
VAENKKIINITQRILLTIFAKIKIIYVMRETINLESCVIKALVWFNMTDNLRAKVPKSRNLIVSAQRFMR